MAVPAPRHRVEQAESNQPPRALRVAVIERDAMNEDYCDYCEREGHTFNQCPARDDESYEGE